VRRGLVSNEATPFSVNGVKWPEKIRLLVSTERRKSVGPVTTSRGTQRGEVWGGTTGTAAQEDAPARTVLDSLRGLTCGVDCKVRFGRDRKRLATERAARAPASRPRRGRLNALAQSKREIRIMTGSAYSKDSQHRSSSHKSELPRAPGSVLYDAKLPPIRIWNSS